MALHKNIANQKVLIFAWDTVNKEPKTGDAGNITAYISKDGGAAVQSNDVNPVEIDATNLKGIYAFDLTQVETNCDLFVLKAVSSTSDVEIDPVIVYTVVRDDYKADVSNLDVAVSSRAPSGEYDTEMARITANVATEAKQDIIDTVVDAIKGKTDNLPVDPASESNVDANEAKIDTIDTIVDAIKVIVENLPDSGALTTLIDHLTDIKGVGWTDENLKTIDALIDAIKAKTDTISWEDITFLKDIEGGKWQIVGNQMIFYKSDNSTEVARFNLFNEAGAPAMMNVFKRERV